MLTNLTSDESLSVITSQNLPADLICQWIYNKPKYRIIPSRRMHEGDRVIPNTDRKKIGYIMAAKTEDNVIIFGWSKCSSHDDFLPSRARQIAMGRLEQGSNALLPESFRAFMPEFLLRCSKYFQTNQVQDYCFYND